MLLVLGAVFINQFCCCLLTRGLVHPPPLCSDYEKQTLTTAVYQQSHGMLPDRAIKISHPPALGGGEEGARFCSRHPFLMYLPTASLFPFFPLLFSPFCCTLRTISAWFYWAFLLQRSLCSTVSIVLTSCPPAHGEPISVGIPVAFLLPVKYFSVSLKKNTLEYQMET